MSNDRLPSYIPSEAFARGVLTLIHEDFNITEPTNHYGAIARSKEGPLAVIVRELAPAGDVDEKELTLRLQTYYEDVIDRVTGWYKRETSYWLLVVGFAVAFAFNVNTISLTDRLASDANLRDRLVAAASNEAEMATLAAQANAINAEAESFAEAGLGGAEKTNLASIAESRTAELDKVTTQIENLKLPFGQCRGDVHRETLSESPNIPNASNLGIPSAEDSKRAISSLIDTCPIPENATETLVLVFGWLITALAISLGAPFWFDLLSKLVAVRKAGVFRDDKDDPGKGKTAITEVRVSTSPTYEEIRPRGTTEIGDVVAESDLERNAWEQEFISDDDLMTIQNLLSVPTLSRTGRMNKETRDAIREYRRNVMDTQNPSEYLDSTLVLKLFSTAPE